MADVDERRDRRCCYSRCHTQHFIELKIITEIKLKFEPKNYTILGIHFIEFEGLAEMVE